MIITRETRILNSTIYCHEVGKILFVNKLSMPYYCISCIGHDLCRNLCITVTPLMPSRLMSGGMTAKYHTVKNKFYNFYFLFLFTAELNGTTTRAMYQEFGLDLED